MGQVLSPNKRCLHKAGVREGGKKKEKKESGKMRGRGEGKKRKKEHLRFKNTQDLVARYETNLRDPMRVSEGNAYLGWSQAFTGELEDVVDNVFNGSF